eukprot:scaffold9121_cov124-Isochrysis_galbana.AAC.1
MNRPGGGGGACPPRRAPHRPLPPWPAPSEPGLAGRLTPARQPSCVGSAQPLPRKTALTCGLTSRSWAFGPASARCRRSARESRPTAPAAGSACPRGARTAAERAPASTGSPRAVPVPWHSSSRRPATATPTCANEARRSVCCAVPFGAVRLALLPSCRTATPSTSSPESAPAAAGRIAIAAQASARAKPSARASK